TAADDPGSVVSGGGASAARCTPSGSSAANRTTVGGSTAGRAVAGCPGGHVALPAGRAAAGVTVAVRSFTGPVACRGGSSGTGARPGPSGEATASRDTTTSGRAGDLVTDGGSTT